MEQFKIGEKVVRTKEYDVEIIEENVGIRGNKSDYYVVMQGHEKMCVHKDYLKRK